MEVNNQYITNIKALITSTLQKKIECRRQNPSTIYCTIGTRPGSTALISIQKTSTSNFFETRYIFQVREIQSKDNLINIEAGQSTVEYFEILRQLYTASEQSIDQKGTDYFNEIISNIK